MPSPNILLDQRYLWKSFSENGDQMRTDGVPSNQNRISRHLPSRSFHQDAGLNSYRPWAKVIDCGDIPITPIGNAVELRQMTEALTELSNRAAGTPERQAKPKPMALGGDHSSSLPALRALRTVHGAPLAVAAEFNYGSVFWKTSNEDLVLNGSSDDRQGCLRDLNIVGADIVEVAPAYDSLGGDTAVTAASLACEIITSWVLSGLSPSVDVPQTARPGSVVTPGLKTEL
ncbi:hypothetical protein B0J12DRAFT_741717 [Macrophomina phaseolina]|uniref:Uncharacterized protein n=1 Tax=Macrophomina phaseolina TaxID=35725 RepID=A0ABQ8G7J5_9PEZI|nr:hypothetical protein B0J12DRAFT_741717 [Macrophomina phaseolina]